MNKISARNLWVDYLRSFITVLVVAHHSSLAYTTFARFDKLAYINSTHAIVDTKRRIGLDIFENFNDIFFMSLMFLISGLFLVKSIQNKGIFTFIKDRIYRLFLPFIFGGTLLMLLAYYPSYYIATGEHDVKGYIIDFFTIEKWPVGPPWFIWVLFVFNVVFACLFPLIKKSLDKFSKTLSYFEKKSWSIILFWFLITFVLHVPFAFWVGAGKWTGFGPFDFQLSRIVLYFGYFLLGAVIGNTDFNDGLFSIESLFVKKWWIWIILCLLTYFILTITIEPLTQFVKDGKIKEFYGYLIYYSIYVASCTFSCIAFITSFKFLINSSKHW